MIIRVSISVSKIVRTVCRHLTMLNKLVLKNLVVHKFCLHSDDLSEN